MIQGLLTTGIFSLADKIKLMKLENKVKKGNAEMDEYYKLMDIYTKARKFSALDNLADNLLKISPHSSIACGRKCLCLINIIQNKLKSGTEISNIAEFANLKIYTKRGIDIIGPHDELAPFYRFDVGLIQYLYGYILKTEGDIENSIKFKEIGLKKVGDLSAFFPY